MFLKYAIHLTKFFLDFLELIPKNLMQLRRPLEKEYAPYYNTYIIKVKGDDVLNSMIEQKAETINLLLSIPKEKWDYRYEKGKWSVKELMLHVLDTERIFCYRALRISRNDKTPMPGFSQDDYFPYCNAENRSAESIMEEYQSVKDASISLFLNMTDEMANRIGTASNGPFSPLAIAHIIVGHETHHMNILKERYL